MAEHSAIAVTTREDGIAEAVSSALESSQRLVLAARYPDVPALAIGLGKEEASVVLVDIDPAPAEILAALEPVIARFSGTRFVVLAGARHSDLVMEAMQIGVRHYLIKASLQADLLQVLLRLVPRAETGGMDRGEIVTFLSAGGGCGATTAAINFANELGLITTKPVLLVDLDCSYGALGYYLGLDGKYGLGDVLGYAERIDGALIRSSALSYSDNLDVLLSPASINGTVPAPDFDHLGYALEAFKRTYAYTVIDAPRVTMDVATNLANASKTTLLTFQLTVKDIHVVHLMLGSLTHRGVTPSQLVLLANRYRKRSPVTLEQAQKVLKGFPLVCASNDFRNAVRSMNHGQPLAEVAPSSVLRRDVRQLAVEFGQGTALGGGSKGQ